MKLPGFTSWFHSCLVKGRELFFVAWHWFLVPWSWFPSHRSPGVVAINRSWHRRVATVQLSMMNDGVSWWAGADSCFHDLVPWLPGEDYWFLQFTSSSLALVPRLPGESSWLSGFTSWIPVFGSMAARWNSLVARDCFLVPWTWFPRLGSLVARWRFLVACSHFLVPYTCLNGCLVKRFLVAWIQFMALWTCFHDCLVRFPGCQGNFLIPRLPGLTSWFHGSLGKVYGCLNSLPGSIDLVPSLPHQGFCFCGLGSMIPPRIFLFAWIRFLVSLTWFPRLSWR